MIPPSAVLIFFALTGLAVLLGSWSWIVALPGSAAAFIGSMAGGAIGLFAILGGALYNAHLNRARDDRLLNLERRALALALRAEVSGIDNYVLIQSRELCNLGQETQTQNLLIVGHAMTHVFDKTADRIGILTSTHDLGPVFLVFQELRVFQRQIEILVDSFPDRDVPEDALARFSMQLNGISRCAKQALTTLDGILSDLAD